MKRPRAEFKRVGRTYASFEGHWLYEYPCTYKTVGSFEAGDGCCHLSCRMAALRAAGFHAVAEQLERNTEAKDWLGNWGRMVYDPMQHGRDPKRRKAAAAYVRVLRRAKADLGAVSIHGCWTGALMGHS